MTATRRLNSRNRQQGLSLVTAIFIIVVLAALGVYMVNIAGVSRATSTLSIQGARAFAAARSGIEWGIHGAFNNTATTCGAAPSAPATNTLTPAAAGLSGYSIAVTCSYTNHREKSATARVFVITATAQFNAFGQADYVQRRLETKVSDTLP
jgi:MSHA biogenesis protein MshP